MSANLRKRVNTYRWKDNTKINLRKIWRESINWTELTLNIFQEATLVIAVTNCHIL